MDNQGGLAGVEAEIRLGLGRVRPLEPWNAMANVWHRFVDSSMTRSRRAVALLQRLDEFMDIVDQAFGNGLGLRFPVPNMRNLLWTTGIDTFDVQFTEDVEEDFTLVSLSLTFMRRTASPVQRLDMPRSTIAASSAWLVRRPVTRSS